MNRQNAPLQSNDQKRPQQPGKAEGVKGGTAKLSHTTKQGEKDHAKRNSFGGYLGRFQAYGKLPTA